MTTQPVPTPSPSERRRERQRDGARRAILAATERLLVEQGYEAFSMRRLAARCGYTAPTIYHHFGDKQGLLDAVVGERFREIEARLGRVRRRADPADTVRAMLAEFVRFGLENPDHYRLLTLPRPETAPIPPSAEASRNRVQEPMAELAAAGRLRCADVEEAAQLVWVAVHGLVSLQISRPAYAWSKNLVRLALDSALAGIVLPAAARTRRKRS